MIEKSRPTLTSIQVLRGMAALFVAVGHIIAEFHKLPSFNGGFNEDVVQFRFGVDLFFVISGFIMVYTTKSKPRTAAQGAQFFLARFLRLSPLYWATTSLTILIAIILPSALNHEEMSASRILTSLFYLPHRNASGDYFPIVGPGWTLNYEMFFYVIFAITFLFPWRRGLFVLVATLTTAVVAGQVISTDGGVVEYYTNPILLEFAAGALLGYAYVRGYLDALKRWVLPATGIAILWIVALHVFQYNQRDQLLFFFGVPATLLVFAAVTADKNGGGVAWPLAMTLGDASYSIYLTHLFVARAASLVVAKLLPDCPVWLFFVSTLVLVAITGHLVARFFEIPAHRLTSRVFGGKARSKA